MCTGFNCRQYGAFSASFHGPTRLAGSAAALAGLRYREMVVQEVRNSHDLKDRAWPAIIPDSAHHFGLASANARRSGWFGASNLGFRPGENNEKDRFLAARGQFPRLS